MAEENSDFMNKIQSLLNSDSLPENIKENAALDCHQYK